VKADIHKLWARLTMPVIGYERGISFRPEVGDEVVVDFGHGDPKRTLLVT
jgi:uncharacterized protein involved in type VI secretion and phage assembly